MAIIRPEAHDDAGEKATPNQIAKGLILEAVTYWDWMLERAETNPGDYPHFDPKKITERELKQVQRLVEKQLARVERLLGAELPY